MVDLDDFKRLNDTHGHQVGDAVLREIAKRLGEPLRSYDAIGRYGGEEFLAVLPGCDFSNTLKVAERMRQTIAGTPLATPTGNIPLTASFGAVSTHASNLDVDKLVALADAALYQAKRAGKNRVEMVLDRRDQVLAVDGIRAG